MNKNQWSLAAFTAKDISRAIHKIQEVSHSEEEFTQLLVQKEAHLKQKALKPEQLLKVLNAKIRRREDENSSLCCCCYESMGSHSYWCKVCGNSTCRKCLVRERQLRDETKAFFCEKCDQEYLQAMDGIRQFNQTEQLERILERLIQEQEGIENLVLLERRKEQSSGSSRPEVASKRAIIEKADEQNKMLKVRCSELSKKIEFGRNISRDLRKKLKELRKEQGQSFGTVSNNDSEGMLEEIDELNLSADHRESILTVGTEMPQDLEFDRKCKCDLY